MIYTVNNNQSLILCSVHMLLKMNITQASQHRLGTYNNFFNVVCNMSLFLQQCAL